ncbi:hypothetical protein V1511DRAFT_497392 [Dipodascopsis uninucleata]
MAADKSKKDEGGITYNSGSSTPNTTASKGLSSKLLTMKFMRQAESQNTKNTTETKSASSDSKWTLGDDELQLKETDEIKSRYTIISGVGLNVIDQMQNNEGEVDEDFPRPQGNIGRRSWGNFNEKFDISRKDDADDDAINNSEDSESEDEEEVKRRRRQDLAMEKDIMLRAQKQHRISGGLAAETVKSGKNNKKRPSGGFDSSMTDRKKKKPKK